MLQRSIARGELQVTLWRLLLRAGWRRGHLQ
jgi:hypothetical protein